MDGFDSSREVRSIEDYRRWWRRSAESTVKIILFTPEQPGHAEQHEDETGQSAFGQGINHKGYGSEWS